MNLSNMRLRSREQPSNGRNIVHFRSFAALEAMARSFEANAEKVRISSILVESFVTECRRLGVLQRLDSCQVAHGEVLLVLRFLIFLRLVINDAG